MDSIDIKRIMVVCRGAARECWNYERMALASQDPAAEEDIARLLFASYTGTSYTPEALTP